MTSYGCGHYKATLHMLNNAHPVPWKPHSKFLHGWSFDWLLIAKQLSVGVAMKKMHLLPYPHMLYNAHPVLCELHAKYWPDLYYILLMIARKFPLGVVITTPHPYVVNG